MKDVFVALRERDSEGEMLLTSHLNSSRTFMFALTEFLQTSPPVCVVPLLQKKGGVKTLHTH